MAEYGGWESLAERLEREDLWTIFGELARMPEIERARILRPHDEVGLASDRDGEAMGQRRRLDEVFDGMTLLEIGYETSVFDERGLPQLLRSNLRPLANLRKLVEESEAFLRYASFYLYFGVRVLTFRWFGPIWMRRRFDTSRRGKVPNRRYFTLPVPPALAASLSVLMSSDRFIDMQSSAQWKDALEFLDGFHIGLHRAKENVAEQGSGRISSQEPVRFELWLRGLLPTANEIESAHFESIRNGLIEWVRSRVAFYPSLPKPVSATSETLTESTDPAGDELITSPLAARFALADIYWIARLFRADVSANASVSYSHVSWLDLLRFKATLENNSDLDEELLKAEEILRSVFDFVCDLAQNSAALSQEKVCKYFNPEDYPAPSERPTVTRDWRAVFDEELREIDRQRCLRTYTSSRFGDISSSYLTTDDSDYWSERLVTGRQPHNRVGMAFSGGGIRSATFNLGVLQGLQEFDLLRHVDYLSTVSGGGFIGSWLAGNVKRAKQWLGRATCWDESIGHLREYSSYLAPLTGVLSADTWTIAATWARNTFLIQITCLAWLFVLLLGALTARTIFLFLVRWYPSAGWDLQFQRFIPTGIHISYVGMLALAMGVAVTSMLAFNFSSNRVKSGKHSPGASWIRWLAILPSWIGAFITSSMLWSVAITWAPQSLDPRSHDYSFILETAWSWIPCLLAAHWIALLVIGWFALRPSYLANVRGGPQATSTMLKGITLWRSVWIGTLCVVVLYLALCAILYLDLWWQWCPSRFQSYAFVFEPALVIAAFTLSVVLFIGLSGRKSNEAQREWWTRFGAWLAIYATAGLALTVAAVFGPLGMILLTAKMSAIKWGGVVSWVGTVVGGILAGKSSKTAGGSSSGKQLGMEILAQIGGLMFVIGAVASAAWVLYYLLLNIATGGQSNDWYWDVLNRIDPFKFAAICFVVALCGVLFSWFFEINIFGLSQFYRNRIVRCYLGATRWAPGDRKPNSFTGFDFNDDMALSSLKDGFRGPFPIYNCTLNLGGSSDLALHTRHSASFSLTPLRCGADRPKVGYAPTSGAPNRAGSGFAGGVMLGQAVAISGAAASPNMGYNTSPLAALLLTMFNVRLGWWFPNPGRRAWAERGLRFSLYYLSRELLGIADETRLFLNISDGGHFENLGVYELVRRRCKVIVACDAECDEDLQFGGLGNLVRICQTDFDAEIDLDVRSIRQQKDNHSLAHCAVGKIKYSNGSIGYLIYIKASVTGDEDIGVAQYRSVHPSFPHETTANQFFSEDQFESYRKLGQHVVRHCLRGVQPGEHPLSVAQKLADVIAPARTTGEAFLKHTRALDRLWEEFRRSPALHSFIDELMHITPPIAVVPPSPANAHQASEELCMALQLIQLMEDVFLDLQLDDFWEHPDNRGWAILFMRWARSPRFRTFWSQTHRTFGIRFEYFCEARLGLTRDVPIVRV